MLKIKLFFICFFWSYIIAYAQTHIEQNDLKTTVTGVLIVEANPKRFELVNLGYNSYHWQNGGVVVIELFCKYFSTGYEKYYVENGFAQGANSGTPKITLVESTGGGHTARLTMGTAFAMGTSFGGEPNMILPIFVDIKDYGHYQARITYLQDRVDVLNDVNQIKINTNPTAVTIPSFSVPQIINANLSTGGNLLIEGAGIHYIADGNVGVGTKNPTEKLSVNGKIRAKEIKVETANWPDYVFDQDYRITGLQDLEKFIKANKHLPEMPTAAEVAKNGVELGEMNKLLLKKIEELTLHLIEKDRDFKKLEQQQSELVKKVEWLMKK